jgi:RHS repeat-associated protein
VTGTYAYDAFGAIRAQTGSSPNEFKFTGEQVDATGMEYLRVRYYDQATGRFLSQDPVPFLQRYAYVGSNPANLTDPYGLFPCPGCGAVVDKIGDAVECGLNRLDCADPSQLLDPLIEMLPEGRLPLGWLPRDPHVSFQLLATCGQYLDACEAGLVAAGVAAGWTKYYYGALETPEGTKGRPKEGDAFTHCYWSGLTTIAVGAGKAERVTTRFEAYGSKNPTDQRLYDLGNNTLGREFAQQYQALGLAAEPELRSYCRAVGRAQW